MRNTAYDIREPEPELDADAIAGLLSTLSNPLRIRILGELLGGERCVSDFVERLGTDQPKVSQHLKLLREGGLILCRAEGRRRCYSLRHPAFVRNVLEASQDIALGGAPDTNCNCDV